jgi:hypothetical protein
VPARKTPANKHDREYEAFVFLDLATPEGCKELRRQVASQDGARPGRSGLTAPGERLLDLIKTRGYSLRFLSTTTSTSIIGQPWRASTVFGIGIRRLGVYESTSSKNWLIGPASKGLQRTKSTRTVVSWCFDRSHM